MALSSQKSYFRLVNPLLKPRLIALVIFCIGLAITFNLWKETQDTNNAKLRAELDMAASQISNSISNRFIAYEVVMRGVKGYFEGSEEITGEEFRSYFNELQIQEKTPGIQGIGLALMLTQADKAKHEKGVRKRDFPSYRIKPEGEREQYAPIVLMEPFAANEEALGFDILTVPEAKEALARSAQTGEVAVTRHITLVQDQGKTDLMGFVMYLPIYRNSIKKDMETDQVKTVVAWVDVPFRMSDLMAGMRGEFDSDLIFEIHDGTPIPGKTRLYRSDGNINENLLNEGKMLSQHEVKIGDHQWTLLAASSPAFEARVPVTSPALYVGISGVTLSLIVSALVWFQASQRTRTLASFQKLFYLEKNAVLLLDANFEIVEANPAALAMFAYSANELRQLRWSALVAKSESQRLKPFFSQLLSGSQHSGEWLFCCKQGTEIPVDVGAHKVDGHRFVVILRDLTEAKIAEQRIHRLTQLYKALSETNQAIVRMENGEGLFAMVCDYAVKYGGMEMAWIGQLDEADLSISSVSAIGRGKESIDGIVVSIKRGAPEECGMIGMAMLENRPVIVNDYLASPLTSNWHGLAGQMGWRSAAAFPVLHNGNPVAVFIVYNMVVDAFQAEEIELLSEMAADVSFALDNWERETQRLLAEKALAESEAKLSLILENVGAHIYLKDKAGKYLYANRYVLDLLGVNQEEIIGFGDDKFFDEETVARIREIDKNVFEHGEIIKNEETNSISKTGKSATYLTIKMPLRRADGSIYALCGISTDISEQKLAEIALRESEECYRLLFDANPVPMWVYDLDTLAFTAVNNAAVAHYGYSREEFLNMGIGDLWLEGEALEPKPLSQQSDTETGLYKNAGIQKHRKKDGSLIWVEINRHPVHCEVDASEIMLAYDISARVAAEQQLRLNAKVFESSREGILITDADNKIVAVNSAYCTISGYQPEEVIGQTPKLIALRNYTKAFIDAMWQEVRGNGFWQGEVSNCRKNGDLYPQWLGISCISDQNGQVTHHICAMNDVTEYKEAAELIQFLSNFDPLTELPNRALLRDRTKLEIASALRANVSFALVFIDLDRFNIVNDSLGLETGDLLLKELAVRLTGFLHSDDTLCRQGGDEFILLLPEVDAERTAHIANQLLGLISQPLVIGSQRVSVTSSIGIALFPQDGNNFEQLSQSADAALFRAKQNGRNNFQFFTRQIQEQISQKLAIENELRLALEHGQLLLHYQPQVDAKTSKIIGVEALIRWQHPLKGMIPPGQFIPIAEESSLIIEIGDWVLHTATRQLVAWQAAGLSIVPVAVNLSVVQFRQNSLYDKIAQVLDATKLNPAMLELEMTEGIAMEDSERTISLLDKLHALGVSLSVDDFGTGYSSLSYLRRYKIDKLKIDRSFISNLGNAPENAIVVAIISLAKSLGFKTIAEGVETKEQLEFLLEKQCDEIQGYYFCKPIPADALADLLSKN